jgi:hypothetical protein
MMVVEWCWGTTRRMLKNDDCVGKLKALGNMLKDTKK